MKTHHLSSMFWLVSAFCVAGFGTEIQPKPVLPPSNAKVLINVAGSATVSMPANPSNPWVGPTRWNDIKELPYPRRAAFFAGLNRLEAQANAQFTELTAQRAAMPKSNDSIFWDFVLEEMDLAQLRLRSACEASRNATPETWSERKDRVGQAWAELQNTVNKLRSPSFSS